MADLYGKEQVWSGQQLQTADRMKLEVVASTEQGLGSEFLVQNVGIQYNRPVNNIYEVGSNKVFFGPTRASGTFQIGRIIGQRLITDLMGTPGTGLWADGGSQSGKTMSFSSFDGTIQYTLSGCIIESYGIATDANGLLVQENVAGRFASLSPNGSRSGSIGNAAAASAIGAGNVIGVNSTSNILAKNAALRGAFQPTNL